MKTQILPMNEFLKLDFSSPERPFFDDTNRQELLTNLTQRLMKLPRAKHLSSLYLPNDKPGIFLKFGNQLIVPTSHYYSGNLPPYRVIWLHLFENRNDNRKGYRPIDVQIFSDYISDERRNYESSRILSALKRLSYKDLTAVKAKKLSDFSMLK